MFDSVYGAMLTKERQRKQNLWDERVTELQFTQDIERYAEFPRDYSSQNKIDEFIAWWKKIGGGELNGEQLILISNKFK